MEKYGQALKTQREIAGYSQNGLSKATGISQQMISIWENNKAIPSVDFCVTLAKFYGCTLDELIGLTENNTPVNNINTPKNFTYSNDEQMLINAYRAMSKGKKQALFSMLDLNINALKTDIKE